MCVFSIYMPVDYEDKKEKEEEEEGREVERKVYKLDWINEFYFSFTLFQILLAILEDATVYLGQENE